MSNKIAVSFLFTFVFLLLANQAKAECHMETNPSNSLLSVAWLNGVGSYSGCSSATTFVAWSCNGQDAVKSSPTTCPVDADGKDSNPDDCVYEGLPSGCKNPQGGCYTSNTTYKNYGDSCKTGGNSGKCDSSGSCHAITYGDVGDYCGRPWLQCKTNVNCGPGDVCICPFGYADCVDDTTRCGCYDYDGKKACQNQWIITTPPSHWEEHCTSTGGGGGGPTAPSLSILANPSTITLGESTTLSYTVGNNADSCTASTVSTGAGIWVGWQFATNGTHIIFPPIVPTTTGTKTYTISCSNAGGTNIKSVNVMVNPVSCPSVCNDVSNHCPSDFWNDSCGNLVCTGGTKTIGCCDSTYHCENFCKGEPCKNECENTSGVGTKDCTWREVAP